MLPAIIDKRLTCSQIRCFRKCFKKHFIAYVLGIRTAQTKDYYRIGDVFHTGLDLRGKGAAAEDAIVAAIAKYDDIIRDAPDDEKEKLLIERQLAARLLDGYFWRWNETDSRIEVLASEITFELPIIDPLTGKTNEDFIISGKIDKIIRLEDGRIALMEHKTTSDDIDPVSSYWKRLRLDIQISIYFLAAKQMGFDIETIVYDVARKPSFSKPVQLTQAQTKQLIETGKYFYKFKGDETSTEVGSYQVSYDSDNEIVHIDDIATEAIAAPRGFTVIETLPMYGDRISADMGRRHEHYFGRREIPRLNSDVVRTRQVLWQYAQMITDCLKEDRWPGNDDACVAFGACPYIDLCGSGFDFSSVPEGFIKVDDVHQELIEVFKSE